MPNWIYDPRTNRYRVTAEGAENLGLRPGTFIGQSKRVQLRDDWTEAQKRITDQLALDYDNGRIPLSDWVLRMREEIKINYIEQYLLGKGGRNNMNPADWGRLGNAIRNQYGFLQGFADDLMNADPPLTIEQIQARARMYVDGSTAMYERADVLARGMPDLPAYPADGSQACKSNCKCAWDIKTFDDRWEATWVLEGGAQHCETCLTNAAQWAPLIIRR